MGHKDKSRYHAVGTLIFSSRRKWLERFHSPYVYIQTSFPRLIVWWGVLKLFYISPSSRLLIPLFWRGIRFQHVTSRKQWTGSAPKSLQTTFGYPRPSEKLLQGTTLSSIPYWALPGVKHTELFCCAAPCLEPRPGIPHVSQFVKWINMDLWCNCGPILTSEALLIMLLARYFSLRHT